MLDSPSWVRCLPGVWEWAGSHRSLLEPRSHWSLCATAPRRALEGALPSSRLRM